MMRARLAAANAPVLRSIAGAVAGWLIGGGTVAQALRLMAAGAETAAGAILSDDAVRAAAPDLARSVLHATQGTSGEQAEAQARDCRAQYMHAMGSAVRILELYAGHLLAGGQCQRAVDAAACIAHLAKGADSRAAADVRAGLLRPRALAVLTAALQRASCNGGALASTFLHARRSLPALAPAGLRAAVAGLLPGWERSVEDPSARQALREAATALVDVVGASSRGELGTDLRCAGCLPPPPPMAPAALGVGLGSSAGAAFCRRWGLAPGLARRVHAVAVAALPCVPSARGVSAFVPDARAALAAANAQCRLLIVEHHLKAMGLARPTEGLRDAAGTPVPSGTVTPAGGPLLLGASAGERLWGASSFGRTLGDRAEQELDSLLHAVGCIAGGEPVRDESEEEEEGRDSAHLDEDGEDGMGGQRGARGHRGGAGSVQPARRMARAVELSLADLREQGADDEGEPSYGPFAPVRSLLKYDEAADAVKEAACGTGAAHPTLGLAVSEHLCWRRLTRALRAYRRWQASVREPLEGAPTLVGLAGRHWQAALARWREGASGRYRRAELLALRAWAMLAEAVAGAGAGARGWLQPPIEAAAEVAAGCRSAPLETGAIGWGARLGGSSGAAVASGSSSSSGNRGKALRTRWAAGAAAAGVLGPEDAALAGLVPGRADLCVPSIRSHANVPSRPISRDQDQEVDGDEDERLEATAGAGAGAARSKEVPLFVAWPPASPGPCTHSELESDPLGEHGGASAAPAHPSARGAREVSQAMAGLENDWTRPRGVNCGPWDEAALGLDAGRLGARGLAPGSGHGGDPTPLCCRVPAAGWVRRAVVPQLVWMMHDAMHRTAAWAMPLVRGEAAMGLPRGGEGTSAEASTKQVLGHMLALAGDQGFRGAVSALRSATGGTGAGASSLGTSLDAVHCSDRVCVLLRIAMRVGSAVAGPDGTGTARAASSSSSGTQSPSAVGSVGIGSGSRRRRGVMSPPSGSGAVLGSVDEGAGSRSGLGAAMAFGGGEDVGVGDRQGRGWALGVPSAGVRECFTWGSGARGEATEKRELKRLATAVAESAHLLLEVPGGLEGMV